MRTTIEMPDELLQRIKVRAAAEGTTVKMLFIRAAEDLLQDKQPKKVRRPLPAFQIGEGAANLTPEQISEIAYGYEPCETER